MACRWEIRSAKWLQNASKGDCETKIVSESAVAVVSGRIKRGVGEEKSPSKPCQGGVAQLPARQPFQDVFSYQLHAGLPFHTPYIHCEKVVQLEENVMGLGADTRLGLGMLLIAADYQAAKASVCF